MVSYCAIKLTMFDTIFTHHFLPFTVAACINTCRGFLHVFFFHLLVQHATARVEVFYNTGRSVYSRLLLLPSTGASCINTCRSYLQHLSKRFTLPLLTSTGDACIHTFRSVLHFIITISRSSTHQHLPMNVITP